MMKLFLLSLCLICSILSASDLDLLYDDSQVAIIEIQVAPEALEWMFAHTHSDSLHPATVHFNNAQIDETLEQVGLRLRGNTSRDAAKKSFKLSFNSFVPGRDFYGVDKLNLNGEHNDPSIMRSKAAWDLYARTGLATTRAAHAAVYINGVYYGLYISVEHIDDEFLQNHFEDDSGNLWKCLWPADLSYRGPDPEDYHPYQDDVRPYELKTNEASYDYSQLAHLIDVINNTQANAFTDSLETILHVSDVLKYAAMNVITGNWDEYWFLQNNYYLYFEPSSQRFHWIPYDYDNSFGIDWFGVDWTQLNPYDYITIEETQGQNPGHRPLMENIMDQPGYRDLYSHFMQFFVANITALPLWENHLDSLQALIAPWAEADIFRTLDYGFSIQDFYESYSNVGYNNQHVKQGLKEFVNARHASLAAQLVWEDAPPVIYAIEYSPRLIGPHDSIRVSVAAFSHVGLDSLTLAFHPGDLAVIESYPMRHAPLPNSSIVEEADRWIGVIPPLGDLNYGRFQVGAVDLSGSTSLYPGGRFIQLQVLEPPDQPLLLNEFMADNESTISDPHGEYEDWMEIFNRGDQDAYLSLMYLTDDPNNLTKWQFPAGGMYLQPQEHLLIWCDEDLDQDGLHVNFKLSAGGEFLALVDIDGNTILDAVNFGPQNADISYGRYPDGAETWNSLSVPTPGSANTSSGVVQAQRPQTLILKNYPNPFNGSTRIQFFVSTPGPAQLSLYDLQGRQVQHVEFNDPFPGEHQLVWEPRDQTGTVLSAGVYILALRQNDLVEMLKLVLIN